MKNCFDLASVALLDLIVRAHERRAACHVASDQENDVDAEEDVGHGSILRAKQQGQEHASDSGDADQNEQDLEVEGDGGHLGLGLLLAALDALVQRPQLVGGLIRGLGRVSACEIADRGLIDAHEYGDLRLRHRGGAKVLDEFGPVHGKTLWVAPYGLSHSFFLLRC